MKRLFHILVFFCFSLAAVAQEETRAIDSLQDVMRHQEGREKVLTMIELSWAFFDFSFDDCVDWSEKAIRLAHETNDVELEGDANYALGIHYGYHSDLDLAQLYLKQSLELYQQSGNEDKAFESLWNLAYFELLLGNMDTAYLAFQEVLVMAKERHDSLACAQVSANLGAIQYQKKDFNGAIEYFQFSREFYELINDSIDFLEASLNLAITNSECGRVTEARNLYVSLIPLLESNKRYYYLLLAYKNYGLMFVRDFINYDSAFYYFEKALAVTELEDVSRADRQTMTNTKADVLVELGNVAVLRDQTQQALAYYEEALLLAENNGYHFGQMQAMLGLGQLYAQQGQAAKSMYYLERYAEEASRSGITIMESAAKKPLILNYARLGRFDEMATELNAFDEEKKALQRENNDLYDQISTIQEEVQGIRSQYDSQNKQLQFLQTQRNHYRLAFFGLLAIVFAMMALIIVYKIVRKNKGKSVKS